MEESYLKALEIVNQKYNESDEYYPLFVTSIYALLRKYPNYVSLINNIFQDTNIFIENDSIDNILKRHNINDFEYDSKLSKHYEVYGISSLGDNFYITESKELLQTKDKTFIACNNSVPNSILINLFLHEMNHLIKGSINSITTFQEDNYIGYSIRNGLSYYEYELDTNTDIITEYLYFDMLDEVINTLETTEIIEEIFPLIDICPNEIIVDYLYTLDFKLLKKDYGYEDATKCFRRIWNDSLFKMLIEDNIIEGNIDEIIDTFDTIMGKDSFSKFSTIIDKIFSSSFKKKRVLIHQLKDMIKLWEKNTNIAYQKQK